MAKIKLTQNKILVDKAYGYDMQIGKNLNSDPTDKVQAFVDCFLEMANMASFECFGLPSKFILAHWGAESGWGSSKQAADNQNWGFVKGKKSLVCKGLDADGYSVFYGVKTFKDAYVHILKNVDNYKELIRYLKSTKTPDVLRCIALISGSGYNEGSAAAYQSLLLDCVASIDRRIDFNSR